MVYMVQIYHYLSNLIMSFVRNHCQIVQINNDGAIRTMQPNYRTDATSKIAIIA